MDLPSLTAGKRFTLPRPPLSADALLLGQLAERINAIGPGWWRGVRAVGPVKAARLVDWLHEHGDSPGLRLDARAALPRRALNP